MLKVGDRVRYVDPRFDDNEAVVLKVHHDGSVMVDTRGEFGICTEEPESIRLVSTGPVQLVPRIIPGTYGKVRVTEGGYVHCKSMKTAEEIRDTIATLEQIAEAM